MLYAEDQESFAGIPGQKATFYMQNEMLTMYVLPARSC